MSSRDASVIPTIRFAKLMIWNEGWRTQALGTDLSFWRKQFFIAES